MAKPAIQTFGKYQILERIATGGTAEIYKAKLEGIGGFQRTFAIKRILPNLSQNKDYIGMLVDEAKVAGLLSHGNVVQILDLGQVDGIWYIAMEYVEGRDLGAVLRRARQKGLTLPVPHAVFIALELLKGLEYAHERQVMRGGRAVPLNIIHRDVSPPNVLLSFQGEVKLTDFGIARASLKVMETVSGLVKGRFDYMSPEQAEARKDLDQRSDLFSVGVVLYEMLTGEHPFRADNELATVERVRNGKYVPVSTRNPDVPFPLQTVVDRALRANRDERYQTATAFKEALDKFFHESGFIFTHQTLATYLKGLFPEANPKKKAKGPKVPRRRREAPASHATPIEGSVTLDHGGSADWATPVTGAVREHDKTEVRPNPLLANGLVEPPDDFADDDNQPTVIRSVPSFASATPVAALAKDPEPSATFPSSFTPATPQVSSANMATAAPVYERARANHQEDTAARGGGGGGLGGLASVVIAIFMLFLGLTVGAVLGVSITLAVSQGPPEPLPSVLEISKPKGVSVKIDGSFSPSKVELTPNESHRVEVLKGEHALYTASVVLKEGEFRHVVIPDLKTPPPTE